MVAAASASAQPPIQGATPRQPPVARPLGTAARIPDLSRQVGRERPQAARDLDSVSRRMGWARAGAPPNMTIVQTPTRLSIVAPRAANGVYLTFAQPYRVAAEGQDGWANFNAPMNSYLSIEIPGTETRGQAFDCAIEGVAAVSVGIGRTEPWESISHADMTLQGGHIFFYVPPEASGRTRHVNITAGSANWWFFNCVTQPV